MNTRVLLVGIEYKGSGYQGVSIETRGLCRPEIDQLLAAAPLNYYNIIIIYPKSYSHFIFGAETKFSDSEKELYDLKHQNGHHDIDTIFNWFERSNELSTAIRQGTKVIWLADLDKKINFYGWRSLYKGYLNQLVHDVMESKPLYMKYPTHVEITSEGEVFSHYFKQISGESWKLCWDVDKGTIPLAFTPEGYCLGCEIQVDGHSTFLITPPNSDTLIEALIQSALGLTSIPTKKPKYHGIFLSHTYSDKNFVRELRKSLLDHGVDNVWLDEAELMVGDSLINKIQQGIDKSEYFGVVLSPRSINSSWVQQELAQAMTTEIGMRRVKVLPLLYENCELPGFLRGKLYADFADKALYKESLEKILRRLEIAN